MRCLPDLRLLIVESYAAYNSNRSGNRLMDGLSDVRLLPDDTRRVFESGTELLFLTVFFHTARQP